MNEMNYAEKIKEWMITNGMSFITNLIVFLLIIIVGKIIINIICSALNKALQKVKRVNDTLRNFIVDVTRKTVWVIVIMIALKRLGIDIAPLIAGLGVTGFVLGFAFQGALGNLAAGIMILLNQPYEVGNVIEAAGHTGCVKELNLMATVMATPDNKKITIPNSNIWGGSIINYTVNDQRRVDLTIGVSYDADINQTRDTLLNAVKSVSGVLNEPAITIEIVEFGDSSVNFVVRPWVKTADYWTVFFKANQAMKEALDKAGIEIPFPQMDIHQK